MKNDLIMNNLRVIVCLLASSAAHGAIIHPLDEMKVLEVPIAQDDLTRIKIQDDRILHVFGNAGDYVLETDDEQGQIFIRPLPLEMNNKSSNVINLTLTTEAGFTQDLRLLPKNQAPETLILQLNTDLDQEVEKQRFSSPPLFREEIEELIYACRENRIPLGYKEEPLPLETLQGPYLLVREIQSQKLRGLTYRIQNKSHDVMVLSEEEIAHQILDEGGSNTVIALSIVKKTLTPGEETDVYVTARVH